MFPGPKTSPLRQLFPYLLSLLVVAAGAFMAFSLLTTGPEASSETTVAAAGSLSQSDSPPSTPRPNPTNPEAPVASGEPGEGAGDQPTGDWGGDYYDGEDSSDNGEIPPGTEPAPAPAPPPFFDEPIYPPLDMARLWLDHEDDGYTAGDGSGLTISGRVTDPWGGGLRGVTVVAFPDDPVESNPQPFADGGVRLHEDVKIMPPPWCEYNDEDNTVECEPETRTDDAGNYTITLTEPGRYRIAFAPTYFYMVQNWQEEWYNNQPSRSAAEAVPAGSSGVDAVMMPASSLMVKVLTGQLCGAVDCGNLGVIALAYRADEPTFVAKSAEAFNLGAGNLQVPLHDLPPGSYKIQVVARIGGSSVVIPPVWFGGAADWQSAQSVTINEGESYGVEINLRAPLPAAGNTIFGSVNSYGEPPIPGTTVNLMAADEPSRIIASKSLSATDFTFNFSGLLDGNYRLGCTLPNGSTYWWSSWQQPPVGDDRGVLMVGGGSILGPIDFGVMSEGSGVTGRVYQAGSGYPLAGGTITATNIDGDKVSSGPSTRSDGSYQYLLRPGTYKICVSSYDNLYNEERYCQEQEVNVGWEELKSGIDILIPEEVDATPQVSGQVKQDGAPAPQQTVYAKLLSFTADGGPLPQPGPSGFAAGEGDGAGRLSTVTDEEGRYTLQLPPGSYLLCTEAPVPGDEGQRFEYCRYPIDVTWFKRLVSLDIEIAGNLNPLSRASGSVWHDGRLAGQPVYAKALTSLIENPDAVMTGTTDAEGYYSLLLPPGIYQACTVWTNSRGEGQEYCSSGVVYAGYDNQPQIFPYIIIPVETGRISGTVTRLGDPVSGQQIYAREAGDNSQVYDPSLPTAYSDKDGLYSLELNPGRYRICTMEPNIAGDPIEFCAGEVELTSGGAATLDMELGVSLTGTPNAANAAGEHYQPVEIGDQTNAAADQYGVEPPALMDEDQAATGEPQPPEQPAEADRTPSEPAPAGPGESPSTPVTENAAGIRGSPDNAGGA